MDMAYSGPSMIFANHWQPRQQRTPPRNPKAAPINKDLPAFCIPDEFNAQISEGSEQNTPEKNQSGAADASKEDAADAARSSGDVGSWTLSPTAAEFVPGEASAV